MNFPPLGPQQEDGYPESRVLIIGTGGTICMAPSEHGLVPARGFLKTGMAPYPQFNDGSYPDPLEIVARPNSGNPRAIGHPSSIPFNKPVQSLRTPPSRYGRQVRYCVYEFDHLIDSSNMDGRGWDAIAQAVADNYSQFDGFVILHGTDSLAYSASALSFMLENLGKPVVLTGSQAPVWQLQSDASDNLLGALVVAGHFMIPEVCLFFNQALYRGNRTTKVSADAFAAFASPNLPPLATVTGMRTRINWDLVCRPAVAPFAVRKHLDTSCVACIRAFPGIQPTMVDSILRTAGLRGLVLESFGAGNIPEGGLDGGPTLTTILAAAVARGIVVVNVSQCLTGTVTSLYAPGRAVEKAGVVLGQDMTTEAALTKLAYLLTFTPDQPGPDGEPPATQAQIAERMTVSIRGELTEVSATRFVHPLVGEPASGPGSFPATPPEPEGAAAAAVTGEVPEPLSDSPGQIGLSPPFLRPPPALSGPALADGLAAIATSSAGRSLTPDQTALAMLSYAITAGNISLVQDVLMRHAHPRRLLSEGDYSGNTALHIAATAAAAVAPASPGSASSAEETPGPQIGILGFLLRLGASVHVRNRAGHTPLFLAARAANLPVVRMLCAAGAHLHPTELINARALLGAALAEQQRKHEGGPVAVDGDGGADPDKQVDVQTRLKVWEEAGVSAEGITPTFPF